jgi:hypothetical protein
MKTPLGLFLALCASSGALHAIDIVASGATGNQVNLAGTYTQNFDSLPSSMEAGGFYNWNNNGTIPGWYSTSSFYTVNETFGYLSSYGSDANDRALGGGITNWSLRFVNTTAQTISGFTVSFDVEQWYRGANNPQVATQLYLYYRIYDVSISEAVEVGNMNGISAWTEVSEVRTNAINLTATTALFLDGNASENLEWVEGAVTGINLGPGQKLWLKWVTGTPHTANPHALATDNVAVSFITTPIPEPATFAALVGLGALAFAQARRRRAA